MSRKNNVNKKSTKEMTQNEVIRLQKLVITDLRSKSNERKGNRKPRGARRINKNSSAPVAMNFPMDSRAAKFNQGRPVTITHRELLATIAPSSAVFTILKRLRLNPGSKQTFRYLANIATSFENYKFLKLRLVYIPRCSSQTAGSLLLSPDYDAADQPPVNELEASSNVDTVEGNAWAPLVLEFNPSRMNKAYKTHYCMSDERFAVSTQDEKTIDAAQAFVCSEAGTITTWGKLWIEYVVELSTPQAATEGISEGGAGTNKTSGLNTGVANVFQNNAMQTNNQEPVPVLEVLDPANYPGPNMFKFARDWSGFTTTQINGTGITNPPLQTLNGVAVPAVIQGIINQLGTIATSQQYVTAKQGDLLGMLPLTATTVNQLIQNLGGASII
jgi:hypothetical protein